MKNNIIKKFTGKINNFIDTKKKEIELYNQKIQASKKFELNYDIVIDENNLIEGNCQEYLDMCAYINLVQAKTIDAIIPINETVLNIVFCIQKIDNQEFFLVFTNFRIFILNKNKFKVLNYQEITAFEIIRKSLMAQIVNFNGIILELDINQKEFDTIYNLMFNVEFHNEYIKEKTKYLCNINPIYQKLNKIKSGVSIDKNNIIVFHDRKINNYICRYQDIFNYELVEDTTTVLKRKTNEQTNAITSTKQECGQMTLKITLVNNQIFEIYILEPAIFNSTYSHKDTAYTKNYNFAKEIIDKLDSLNPNLH